MVALEMRLPAGRIMKEVEHELLHMDGNMENKRKEEVDVLDENMENNLDGITLEVVE